MAGKSREIEQNIVAMTTTPFEWTEALWNLMFIQWLDNGRKPLVDDDIKRLQALLIGKPKKKIILDLPASFDEKLAEIETALGMTLQEFFDAQSKKARNNMNPEGTVELKADDVSQSTDAVCEIVRILRQFRTRDERRHIMNAVAAFCIDDR